MAKLANTPRNINYFILAPSLCNAIDCNYLVCIECLGVICVVHVCGQHTKSHSSVHVATHTQPQTNIIRNSPFCKSPFHNLCVRETNDIWRDWMFPQSLHHLGKSEGSLFYLPNPLHLPCSNMLSICLPFGM